MDDATKIKIFMAGIVALMTLQALFSDPEPDPPTTVIDTLCLTTK